jgi:Tfp pilus assembly protein PilN
MIRINLLPKELQQAARTPMKLFVTVLTGVALATICVCTYAYVWFNVIVLEERADRKREELEHIQKGASEVDSLLDDIADYKERERTIISIKTNRILWSRKLDELCRITPSYIWIVRMDMRELDPREYKWEEGKLQTGGYMKLKCYSSGDDVERMTAYRQKLKSADEFYLNFIKEPIKPDNFYSDFINITPPEWRFVLLKGYRDPNNIRFSVRLDLRPLAEKRVVAQKRKA